MQHALSDPFYYLGNFQRALDWVAERHAHLLSDEELAFAQHFPSLPQAARALLVRMVMRKGDLFRASKLHYPEIGCPRAASLPLIECGWVDASPVLGIDQLFALLTKPELATAFSLAPCDAALPKPQLLATLRSAHPHARSFGAWWPASDDCVFQLRTDALCERLRLLFFGNGHQDWSEFVLAELGIVRYEKVELTAHAFGFKSRADVETWLQIRDCREHLEQGTAPHEVLARIPEPIPDNLWLEGRRAKLLFALGRQQERAGELEAALDIYTRCTHAEARARRIRALELLERHQEACALALTAAAAPESEAERQQLARMLPRLRRKAGLPKAVPAPAPAIRRIDLELPPPDGGTSVEQALAAHLTQPQAPVYYVENTLFNALFGLLCWPAIFAPVPGAFFHPFQAAPSDLYSPDFHARRQDEFGYCLSQLDNETYQHTIRHTFREKHGIQSPFVAWDWLDEEVLELALACIPSAHLKTCFARMLFDPRTNCSGLPDLIQFFPGERRYRMIEVKGPGDRLQDNQIRWLEHFATHDMPAVVCHVGWEQA